MRFGVLGTLVVTDDEGQALRLGGPARRRLLAALVARAGRVVPLDTLIDDLWSDVPPASAEKTLQSHLVRLRADLGTVEGISPIRTEAHGYRLDADPEQVDFTCFERGLDEGRRAVAEGDLAAARDRLDEALAWWRGDAYADFPDAPFAVTERPRLAELRALALELRTDAALALGEGADLVPGLEVRVQQEPYRERTWQQLMLALYRSGRQAEALAAYRRARERLVDDLGVEPSAALTDLQARMLARDPELVVATVGQVVPTVDVRGPSARLVTAATGAASTATASTLDVEVHGSGRGPSVVDAPVVERPCPYRGLAFYDEDDFSFFVGRERLTAELIGRLVDNDLLVVVGASGAGKSSLVRAGVLPSLRHGALPGSAAWRIRVTTPAAGLDRIDGRGTDLLVVDQAEELFTLAEPTAALAVGRRLSSALSAGCRVVLVLRADFYGRLAGLDVVTGRIGSATVLVGPMTENEVRRVVVEPPARCGVSVEEPLVGRVVSDVVGRDGALPLLSAALEQAWLHHDDGELTLDDYRAGGGVRGALEAMAERVYGELDGEGRGAARRVLLGLVTLHRGVWSRRPAPLEDVVAPGDEAAATALDALAAARLVTVGQGTVDLTHEALLDGWPRLRRWLDDRAVMADQLDHLAATATAWDLDGRPDADLLRGPRLQAALDWMTSHPDDLTRRQREYVEASSDAAEATARREHRRRRTLTVMTACFAATALVASLVSVAAVQQKDNADRAATAADARRLAAQSFSAPDEPTALKLAVASYSLQDSPESRGALLSAIEREHGIPFRVVTSHPLLWVGAPVVGGPILAVDDTQHLLTIDATTHVVVSSVELPAPGGVAAAGPDGRTLITSDTAHSDYSGALCVVEVATGECGQVLTSQSVVNATTPPAALTGDGRFLAVLEHLAPMRPGEDQRAVRADTVTVYDSTDWIRPPRLLRMGHEPVGIASGHDRIAITYSDGTLEVRSARTLAVVDRTWLGSRPSSLALSPDGTRVAFSLASSAMLPRLLTVGHLSGMPLTGESLGSTVDALSFSRDGALLAAASTDGALLVVATDDGGTVVSVPAGGQRITSLAWGGTVTAPLVLTAGTDGDVVAHDLRALPPTVQVGGYVRPDDQDGTVTGHVVVSTDSSPVTIDAGSIRTRLRVLDLRTGAMLATWPVPLQTDEAIVRLSTSRDGTRTLVTTMLAGGRAHFRVWDTTSGEVLLDRDQRWVFDFAPLTAVLSDDGRTMYQSTGVSGIDVVDVGTGAVLRRLTVHLAAPNGYQEFPFPMSDGPAGTLVVWGAPVSPPVATPTVESATTTVTMLATIDATTGQPVAQRPAAAGWPIATTVSADRARIAIGTNGGTLSEYALPALTQVDGDVAAHAGAVTAVSFSGDGTMLLTSGADGVLRFWDAASLAPIGSPLHLGTRGAAQAWYLDDGSIAGLMPSGASDGRTDTHMSMPGSPAQWLTAACEMAGGGMSRDEWSQAVGDRPYQATCPSSS